MMLISIPDDAMTCEVKGKDGYGGSFSIVFREEYIAKVRRETDVDRIVRYLHAIETLLKDGEEE